LDTPKENIAEIETMIAALMKLLEKETLESLTP